jgi:hypothetical protein
LTEQLWHGISTRVSAPHGLETRPRKFAASLQKQVDVTDVGASAAAAGFRGASALSFRFIRADKLLAMIDGWLDERFFSLASGTRLG